VPSEPMASTFACEFPACVQPNALQKRYSARSPVGLFELRLTPRALNSSQSLACSASSCAGVNSDRSILFSFLSLLRSRLRLAFRTFPDRKPFSVKYDAILFAIPHVVIERN